MIFLGGPDARSGSRLTLTRRALARMRHSLGDNARLEAVHGIPMEFMHDQSYTCLVEVRDLFSGDLMSPENKARKSTQIRAAS